MTGKEALKQLEEKYHKYITEWYYMSNMSKEERSRLYSMYDEEIKVIDKELTKYNRVFEILKDNVQISIKKCLWDGETIYYLVINQESGDQIQFRLSKEEKELLEELMKGD